MTSRHPSRRAWPRLVALLCVLTLAFGADAPDNYKGYAPAWLRYLWPRNAYAALSPKTFEAQWAAHFNMEAAADKSKLRVWTIACRREGEAVFRCTVLFYIHPSGYQCDNLALGSSGQLFSAVKVGCPAAALKAAGIGTAPKA